MENKSIIDNSVENNDSLELTSISVGFLKEAAKWAKFLSILGFVWVGLWVLFSFFMGAYYSVILSLYSPSPNVSVGAFSGTITITYLIIAVIAFFPPYFMYKFANNVKEGISFNNTEKLTSGLGSLKSYFKFNGILAIVALTIYLFVFILMVIAFMAVGLSAF